MHGQAERVARLERVGTGRRAGKVQARELLQEAACSSKVQPRLIFVGSAAARIRHHGAVARKKLLMDESLSRFSCSCSRSRSHSPKYCPHEALLARSAAVTPRLAQRRSRATAAVAATAETTASNPTEAVHSEWQNFWRGRPSEGTTVADFVKWRKSQGVTEGKWELVKSSTASSPQEDETQPHTGASSRRRSPSQPAAAAPAAAAASRRSPSSSSRWSSNSHWSSSPSR